MAATRRPLVLSALVLAFTTVLWLGLGAASSAPYTTSPTTSTNQSYAEVFESFESESGPYEMWHSNATVQVVDDPLASDGDRTLRVECPQHCSISLVFPMDGWLTYQAKVSTRLEPDAPVVGLSIYAGSANGGFAYTADPNSTWRSSTLQVGQCVQHVQFVWTSGDPALFYIDAAWIERSTTTASPTRDGASSCSSGPTTYPHCPTYTSAPYVVYTSGHYIVYATCPTSPTCTTYHTATLDYAATTSTYPGTTCYYPATTTTTVAPCSSQGPTPTTCPVTTMPSESPRQTVTVTVTDEGPRVVGSLAGVATLVVLFVAALLCARRMR